MRHRPTIKQEAFAKARLIGCCIALLPPLLGCAQQERTTSITETTNTLKPWTVVEWGWMSDPDKRSPTHITDVAAIAAGDSHTLLLRSNGVVSVWVSGRGKPTLRRYDARFRVPNGLTNAMAIAAGGGYSLALKDDGTVDAWGDNGVGQTPVPAGLTNVVAIAAGCGDLSAALKVDGTVTGWGPNTTGASGVGILDALQSITNAVAIATGYMHLLVLKDDGTVVELGDQADELMKPDFLTNIVAIAVGSGHNLALRSDGTVVAWKQCTGHAAPDYGQSSVPPGLSNVVSISTFLWHNLALKADGTVIAWGWNDRNQTNVPSGVSDAVAIAAGHGHSAALVGDGRRPLKPVFPPQRPALRTRPTDIQGHYE